MSRRVPEKQRTASHRLDEVEARLTKLEHWKRLVSRAVLGLNRQVTDLRVEQTKNEAAAIVRHGELMGALSDLRMAESEVRGHWACPLRTNPDLTRRLLGMPTTDVTEAVL
jgi:hypothetical protein